MSLANEYTAAMRADAAMLPVPSQHVRSRIGRLSIRTKVWFEIDGEFVIGEHGLNLLEAIAREGSLAGAARAMGWSYRHAWGYIRRAESRLSEPLLIQRAGRGRSKGANLSPLALQVLKLGDGWRSRLAKSTQS